MFSEIEDILFPDCCEVIQLCPSQQFVFPIMKNGSSSFYENIILKKWKVISEDKISSIDSSIVVFVRDPKSRFISGVNTYIQHTLRDNPNLDEETIIWFINQYLFLNRHYCPQFFWLLNLSRFLNKNVQLEIKSIESLKNYTNIHSDANVVPSTDELLTQINNFNWNKLELYFYLDQMIVEFVGKNVTWNEIRSKVVNNDILNKLVFAKSTNLVNQLICGVQE